MNEMTAREFLTLVNQTCIERKGRVPLLAKSCSGCDALNICPQSQFPKDMDIERVLVLADELKQKAASTTNADDLGV